MLQNDLKYMIRIESLSKSYGIKNILNKLDLTVGIGELAIVKGSNGSGKTTVHLLLASLVKPDKGNIEISGINIQDDPVATRSNIGYVAHEPFLYPALTVKENLNFFTKLHNTSYANISQLYEQNDLLQLLNISDKLDSKIETLSHGYRKKVGIICSLIHNPSVLLLDEPETGLDTEGFNGLIKIIDFLINMNKSILITTHADSSKFSSEFTHYELRDGRLFS